MCEKERGREIKHKWENVCERECLRDGDRLRERVSTMSKLLAASEQFFKSHSDCAFDLKGFFVQQKSSGRVARWRWRGCRRHHLSTHPAGRRMHKQKFRKISFSAKLRFVKTFWDRRSRYFNKERMLTFLVEINFLVFQLANMKINSRKGG